MLRGLKNVILHLLEYRITPGHEAEVGGYLRHQASSAPPAQGLVSLFVGHRLGKQGREHLAATLWTDEAALDRGTDKAGVPRYLAPKASMLGDKAASRYRVLASTKGGSEGARVLRLYRTSIAAGSVELWERRALEPVDLLAATEGLLTVVAGLGIDRDAALPGVGNVRVVVLTAWTEWTLLLGATGGRLNRPLVGTELEDLEEPATADHFELVGTEPRTG